MPADLLSTFLVFCRIGACFMVLPGMSSARVPPQVRLFASLAIAVAVSTFIDERLQAYLAEPGPAVLLRLAVSEILIGLFFGLIARFYLLALEFIISGVAMSIGFGGMLGAMVDGFEMQAALTAFISLSALMVLFTLDFHHHVIVALLGSYDVMPFDTMPDMRLMLVDLVDVLRESFLIALRLGSPFIGFAIIINLGVGLLNKLSVQIPIYFISLPFVLAIGLVILYYSAPYMLSLFGQGFTGIYNLR
ncbi:flagellar type III secretion system protein FliR [Oricola cellulosilytica]|uniref:Flagellar type III secretion system protein FliR n=1 Tax=Oricola cellulosilytica TaxID=1429082 RepID=A0A4V2MP82_9HYPH|nr:flagellar type III secretion system protein FliR [Oricola cellulosilytica]